MMARLLARTRILTPLVALAEVLAGLLGVTVVAAQEAATDNARPAFELPDTWLNTVPPTAEALRGKAVLLYFFEETCPKCKARWPAMLKIAADHALDPIVFVAVNSGTPAVAIDQYAHGVRLSWPIIVDVDRSFEKACGVGEISLQNIVSVCYITAQGQLKRGRWDDVEGTVAKALEGASWKVDPADVPDDLKVAWRNIEFANYSKAAPTLTKALASRKSDVKAAAQTLSDAVTTQATADLEAAASEIGKSKYRAHERYATIAKRYAGFPAAQQAAAASRELAKDPALRAELAAIKAVEKQSPLVRSPSAPVRDRAIAAIQKIVAEHPESEAARLGRDLLEQK
jgi:thiol-disulfide isomerase/thioredoxin